MTSQANALLCSQVCHQIFCRIYQRKHFNPRAKVPLFLKPRHNSGPGINCESSPYAKTSSLSVLEHNRAYQISLSAN